MCKKIAAILCSLCMLFSVGSTAMATSYDAADTTPSQISPRYSYATFVDASLDVSNGTAYVYVTGEGNSSVTRIKITARLQKKSGSGWSTIKTWTQTTYDDNATLDESYSVSSGTYRVSASIDYNSGKEVVSILSNVV